jgi:hypothetical protein
MTAHLRETIAEQLQHKSDLSEICSRQSINEPSEQDPSRNELSIFQLSEQLSAGVSSFPNAIAYK